MRAVAVEWVALVEAQAERVEKVAVVERKEERAAMAVASSAVALEPSNRPSPA